MTKLAEGVTLEYTRGRVSCIGFINSNKDLDSYKLDRLLDKHWSLAQTMGYEEYRRYVLDNELVENVTYSKTENNITHSRITLATRLRRRLALLLDPERRTP